MAEMFSLLLFLMLIGYTLRYLILSRTLSPSCHLNSSWSPTHTSKCTPQLRRLFACLLVCVLVTPGVAENDLSIILQSVVDNGTGYTMDWGIYLNDLNVGFVRDRLLIYVSLFISCSICSFRTHHSCFTEIQSSPELHHHDLK